MLHGVSAATPDDDSGNRKLGRDWMMAQIHYSKINNLTREMAERDRRLWCWSVAGQRGSLVFG
jgi:hypothetical protein